MTTREIAEELKLKHSKVVWHLKQIGQLSKRVPHELTKRKKSHFEVLHSLTLCKNNEPFLNWTVMCSEKWILYDS